MESQDTRGLTCPIPLFYVKQRIERMGSGSLLEVFADDEKARNTIPRWCGMHGHEVVEIVELGEYFKILIRKS
ncbi:MAG: sulfurtransferase TusA family protein [Methanosarcinales archaeon]